MVAGLFHERPGNVSRGLVCINIQYNQVFAAYFVASKCLPSMQTEFDSPMPLQNCRKRMTALSDSRTPRNKSVDDSEQADAASRHPTFRLS